MFQRLNEQQQLQLQTVTAEQSRTFFKWVYGWMTAGLVVTTVIAYLTMNTNVLDSLLQSPGLIFGALIGQIVLVIALGAFIRKMSPAVAAIMFLAYSALTGFTLSIVVASYTAGTVTAAFATTALLFGVMTIVGFTTTADLSKIRTLGFFVIIGLIIAMVVNIFLQSSVLELVISFIGVILFIGLIAADTQKLKLLAAAPEVQADRTNAARVAILGALTLYLDVINLFLFLLRLFGGGSRR